MYNIATNNYFHIKSDKINNKIFFKLINNNEFKYKFYIQKNISKIIW